MKLARLHHRAGSEPYWHVEVAVVAAIGLQLVLSSGLYVGPKYVIAGLEVILLVALAFFATYNRPTIQHIRRGMAILLIALVSLANISSLLLVIGNLLSSQAVTGKQLIAAGLAIYLTNIIMFGLWYWELDNVDQHPIATPTDFLFPQMSLDQSAPAARRWNPTFFDYLYVSLTNASAFSPTDTLPLSHRAKLLMAAQSVTSLVTVALVAARAVNILG